MPSTFDPLLRLELQATGENATTWGIKTNTNLDLLAESIAGAVTLNVAGSGDFTLSTANGATDEARQAILILTGLLTGDRNIIVPSSPKNYTVINQTTGAFTVTLKQSAGTGLPIPAGGPTITVCTSTTCVDSIGATPYGKTLLAATSAQVAVSVLGLANTATIVATSIGSALITAVDTSAARTAIDAVGTGALTTSGLTMSTDRLLGRTTASSGAVEEISVGSGLTLSSGSLVASPSGLLLNTQVFTSSGTYTRTSGATRAVVIAVGGGGGGRGSGFNANGGTGGTTSFGSHVTAIGGSGGTLDSGGAGGTGGSGATIAIPGQGGGGAKTPNTTSGMGGGQGGGRGVLGANGVAGSRGGGGSGFSDGDNNVGAGGGQGETGIKYITSGLGATETVTIGAGGAAGTGTTPGGAGGAGYIIVYEYS
jgi:hypothetical protein